MTYNNYSRSTQKIACCFIFVLGIAYAVHGYYGFIAGADVAFERLTSESKEILGEHSRPTDPYGATLYDSIRSLPSEARQTIRHAAMIQTWTGSVVAIASIGYWIAMTRLSTKNSRRNQDRQR